MSDMENNQQNQNTNEEAPKTTGGPQQTSAWKKLLAKKWVFPATYMVAAAIILSLMWVYQGMNDSSSPAGDLNPGLDVTGNLGENDETGLPGTDTTPVNAPLEEMQWPVVDTDGITVLMPFYEATASAEERAAALVYYDNEYTPNMGVSIGKADDSAFEVAAALSGTVTRVAELPLVGHVVEITHSDGLVTVYQSLDNVMVKMNEQVQQGQVIAHAGRNELERDLGVHLHFEVRENDKPLNPQAYLPVLSSELDGAGAVEQTADSDEAAESDVADGAEDEAVEDHGAEHSTDTEDGAVE